MRFAVATGLLLAAALLVGCAVHINAPQTQVAVPRLEYTVVEDVAYVPADWPQRLTADLYLPEGAGPFPAVLVVHGGGWQRGERGDMAAIAAGLAQAGFVAMNISYRFAPEYHFPAQVHDLQQALRWLRGHHKRYDIDPKRVGAFGYSAGAHLVALLGTISPGDPLDAPYGGPKTRLQAVVAGGTPTDLRKYEGGELVPTFLGGDQSQVPQAYALASPVTHVSRDDAAFFLYHGVIDTLVPIDHAEDFKKRLTAAGVPVEVYRLPLGGHVSTFFSGAAAKKGIQFLIRRLR